MTKQDIKWTETGKPCKVSGKPIVRLTGQIADRSFSAVYDPKDPKVQAMKAMVIDKIEKWLLDPSLIGMTRAPGSYTVWLFGDDGHYSSAIGP